MFVPPPTITWFKLVAVALKGCLAPTPVVRRACSGFQSGSARCPFRCMVAVLWPDDYHFSGLLKLDQNSYSGMADVHRGACYSRI